MKLNNQLYRSKFCQIEFCSCRNFFFCMKAQFSYMKAIFHRLVRKKWVVELIAQLHFWWYVWLWVFHHLSSGEKKSGICSIMLHILSHEWACGTWLCALLNSPFDLNAFVTIFCFIIYIAHVTCALFSPLLHHYPHLGELFVSHVRRLGLHALSKRIRKKRRQIMKGVYDFLPSLPHVRWACVKCGRWGDAWWKCFTQTWEWILWLKLCITFRTFSVTNFSNHSLSENVFNFWLLNDVSAIWDIAECQG